MNNAVALSFGLINLLAVSKTKTGFSQAGHDQTVTEHWLNALVTRFHILR